MNQRILKNLLPNYRFNKLIDISPDFFLGSQLIIFDIDNTLVLPETAETKKEVIDWFDKINGKYRCIFLSNSKTIFKREKQISKLLNCEVFLSRRKKPFKNLFEKIKEKYDIGDGKILVIGDRVFTDILFGNLNGAVTVLIKPLSNGESILVKIIRKLENFILFLADLTYN